MAAAPGPLPRVRLNLAARHLFTAITAIAGALVCGDVIRPLVDVALDAVRARAELELFVAVLGASSYTYAEATRTKMLADITSSNARALAYFGGVPNAIVPDQLKSAVTIASRYEAGLQRTLAELGRHYGTTILPARPRSPRDKARARN